METRTIDHTALERYIRICVRVPLCSTVLLS
ncbi:hypothetical protein NP493_1263g00004 [Ridgeia piscesae]|uniref:Uncharacterized protein n=1 Tax=Ridgeia piscesae TaxID=27915 RepID=A0AAD9KAE7_RIDPI|nr:hypothetical protein NP493_1263g00004 [Ridgeia piscesae]